MTVAQAWKEYLAKVNDLAEGRSLGLLPAASQMEIEECEQAIGVSLPEGLKEIYRVNNGQEVSHFAVFPEAHEFLPLKDMTLVWRQLSEARSQEPRFLWHPNWVPFAQTVGGGVLCCVCSSTGSNVVQFYPESERERVASESVGNYIMELSRDVDQGRLALDANNSCLSYEKA